MQPFSPEMAVEMLPQGQQHHSQQFHQWYLVSRGKAINVENNKPLTVDLPPLERIHKGSCVTIKNNKKHVLFFPCQTVKCAGSEWV